MSATGGERLYRNLPAVFRVRDAREGEPLRTLLGIVEDELQRLDGDIAALYDNWFIETCDEWVVPYIGDLLGVRPIRSVESAGVSVRAYVANTIAYRRRKGTAAVLEQLARDTTGWPAHAVEFFTRLITTQHVNHVRLAPPATAAIRDAEAAELVGTAFDPLAHTADVRRIATGRGRHNIPNVGIFLWRLQSYPIGRGDDAGTLVDFGTARRLPGSPGPSFTFNPVGLDAPLFNLPRTEETITQLSREENVPGRLRRLALHEELERLRLATSSATPPSLRFFSDAARVFRVLVELAPGAAPVEIPPADIFMCTIPDEVELASLPPLAVAVDPARGRLAFAAGLDPHRVFVTFNYGFSGDLGGGPYDRTRSIEEADEIADPGGGAVSRRGFLAGTAWQAGVSHLSVTDPSGRVYPSLRDAVAAWNALPPGRTGVITIMDSLSEHDAASPPDPVVITIGERSRLLIAAADWPLEEDPEDPTTMVRRAGRMRAAGVRAHFAGDLVVRGVAPVGSPDPGELFVDGLLLEGQLRVDDGHLGLLAVAHATLVPDHGGLAVVDGNERLRVALRRSISGPLSVPVPIRGLEIRDSIVDGAPSATGEAIRAESTEAALQGVTLFGSATVETISASDSIFAGSVTAERRQVGCVRFSYLAEGSTVPKRYRCQPDAASARVVPVFASRRYGDPAYAQLARRCPVEIREGAESGAEMGAFSFLQAPQREANLRSALEEYLRLGLEVGVVYVT